jgi:D-glycerate 3-kinase
MVLCSEHMKAVNKELRAFDKFYEELDGLVVIKIDNLDWVYQYALSSEIPVVALHLELIFLAMSRWREQPEQLLREAKKPAMTPAEVRDFVDRFMPAYKTYLKGLYADPKDSTSPLASVPRLIFSITSAREPAAKPVEFNFSSQALQD